MTLQHPHAELSAYIDEALAPADRAAVDRHLAACAACRAHVTELRATSALVRTLPDPIPSRHLVPRLGVPAWLAPLRTLMSLASGAAVFLFIASALVSNITFLAGAGAPATTSVRDSGAEGAARAPAPDARPTTAPGVAQGHAASPETAFSVASPSASPSLDGSTGDAAAGDTRKRLESTAAPPAPGEVTTTYGGPSATQQPRPSPLLNPWLWLAVAVLSGAFAIALHRRLRSAA